MVILNEGTDKTALEFKSLITKGQMGTGTTDPTPSDTGLETPIAATLLDVVATSSGNSSQFTHTITSTLGNGNTLTEFEVRFADGTSLLRTVGADIIKDSGFEIQTIQTINFTRG